MMKPRTSTKLVTIEDNDFRIHTAPSCWKEAHDPLVIPISVHSAIHTGAQGYFKVAAYIEHIKKLSVGEVIILFAEGAHLNTLSLNHANNIDHAFQACLNDAKQLQTLYASIFSGCSVYFWHELIKADALYQHYINEVTAIIKSDAFCHDLLVEDLATMYNDKFAAQYPDRESFVSMSKLDIIEMLAANKILQNMGCRFIFYPGPVFSSMKHFQTFYYPQLTFVNVGIKFLPRKYLLL